MWNICRKIRNKIMLPFAVRGKVRHGKHLHVGPGTVVWAPTQLTIGNDVYIGKHCTIEVDGQIGNNVLMANNVGLIGRHDHDFRRVGKSIRESGWVGEKRDEKKEQVMIGDDVWIGYGAVVLSGTEIGRGAVIGAGAVVTHSIEPYAIAVGNPARVIGKRFSCDEMVKHEKLLYGQILTR